MPINGVVCPSDVYIILPKGKSSVPAVSPEIQGTSNFKIIPDLKRFSFGNTRIKVIATSKETNEEVKCNYTVHIIGECFYFLLGGGGGNKKKFLSEVLT